MEYERWVYYVCYEIAVWYAKRNPVVVFNPWYKRLLDHCLPYWVEVRAAMTMEDVDRQAAEIADEWKVSVDPVYSEREGEVEGLPEMRLRAPWVDPE